MRFYFDLYSANFQKRFLLKPKGFKVEIVNLTYLNRIYKR